MGEPVAVKEGFRDLFRVLGGGHQEPGSPTSTRTCTEETTPRCDECGEPKTRYTFAGREAWVRECECERRAEAERRAKARDEEKRWRKERLDRLFEQSALGPRFRACTFESWSERPGTTQAHQAAWRYAEEFEERTREGRGLLLFGGGGNGKSHLAAAIVNRLVAENVACVFQTVPTLLRRVRATFARDAGASEEEILGALVDVPLLVLDDAGAEKHTEWGESTLYYLVDERYRRRLPLVVTSNLNLSGLEEAIGFRAVDRLMETCELVEVTGTSYRQELARNRPRTYAEGPSELEAERRARR